MSTDPPAVLEGIISVEAALRSDFRDVQYVLANREKLPKGFGRLRQLAEARGVNVRYASEREIQQLAEGRRHGGVVALVGPRRFQSPTEVLGIGPTPFLVMIDGVEDPFNFGQGVRSVYAAGATGLFLRPRNWMSAAGVVARSSAGASELLPAAIVDTVNAASELCASLGIETIVLTESSDRAIYEHDLTRPLLLVIGGEQRGVTRSFQSAAHTKLAIPFDRAGARSLGTAPAAAVAAFEVMRQRIRAGDR